MGLETGSHSVVGLVQGPCVNQVDLELVAILLLSPECCESALEAHVGQMLEEEVDSETSTYWAQSLSLPMPAGALVLGCDLQEGLRGSLLSPVSHYRHFLSFLLKPDMLQAPLPGH